MSPLKDIESKSNRGIKLKKHVGLIHSSNKLSLLERKVSNALLASAYENLDKFESHKIHINTLCDLIGYNSKDTAIVKEALKSLMATVLEWNIIDQSKKTLVGWAASTMLACAEINGPICTYSYSPQMRQLCYRPEIYGLINMKVLSEFRSTYGLALYENCIRFSGIPQTSWFDIQTYRKLMGVSEGKYKEFSDLNKRVIKPAVEEVNKKSPIHVQAEFEKQGREVVRIRFKISKPTKGSSTSQVIEDETPTSSPRVEVFERLIDDYGLSHEKTKKLKEEYEDSYIVKKMDLIEGSESFKKGGIRNMGAYLEKPCPRIFRLRLVVLTAPERYMIEV